MAAQGDVLFIKRDSLPKGLVSAPVQDGKHIVAHSETGHHHTVAANQAHLFISDVNEFVAYMEVYDEGGATLEHERSFDTHESLHLDQGFYEIRKQREFTLEGFRRALD